MFIKNKLVSLIYSFNTCYVLLLINILNILNTTIV